MQPAPGYEGGKSFASSYEDAVRWGRAMQRVPQARPFRIAAIGLPEALRKEVEFHARWDAIGPAYYVLAEQLSILNRAGPPTVFERIFAPGDDDEP